VYFPEVKGFAVQWHPEMMASDEIATAFIFEEMEKRL
jgi:gamma-glutamyl-gamma-aminobutyrate hydrolase PuuD